MSGLSTDSLLLRYRKNRAISAMKAAMEDRTPSSSGETEEERGEKRKEEKTKIRHRQTYVGLVIKVSK